MALTQLPSRSGQAQSWAALASDTLPDLTSHPDLRPGAQVWLTDSNVVLIWSGGAWQQSVSGGSAHTRALHGTGSPVYSRYFTPSLGHNWVKVQFPKSTISLFVMAKELAGAFIAVAADLEKDSVADMIFTGGALTKATVTTSVDNDDVVQSVDAGWIPVPCDGQVHEVPLTGSMQYGNVYMQHSASDGAGGGVGSDGFIWVGAQS